MKAVMFVTLVTLVDLMRGVVTFVTLVTMVYLKVRNKGWGLYMAVTLVTLEIRKRKL